MSADDGAARGHRLLTEAAGVVVEAWGADRVGCLVEALTGLVESFAEVPDAPVTRTLSLPSVAGGRGDELVALFEEVVFALDVFGVVPVRFHLAETEDGSVAGDMEVVPSSSARLVGPPPKGIAADGLSVTTVDGAWRCRALVDV